MPRGWCGCSRPICSMDYAGRYTWFWPTCPTCPADVKDYEPHVALFGGERGTELIERLLAEARPMLAPGAELCVELDEEEQATPIASLARTLYGGATVGVCQDHGGYDRVVRIVTAIQPAAMS